MQPYRLAHLIFTVDTTGCLCLDTISSYQPGGATPGMTTPAAITYVPGFNAQSCCFTIAEFRPPNQPPVVTCPDQIEGFGGDVIPISVHFADPDSDNCVDCQVTVPCGTASCVGFTGGPSGSFTVSWNTEGCTDDCGTLQVGVQDEFGRWGYCEVEWCLIYAAGFVTIDQDDCANICDIVYLPVYLQNFVEFGGFKLLVEWDPNVLTLHDVLRGDCIDDMICFERYMFERFFYEWLPCTDIHKKKIKIVGLADMPDGYQGYPIEPHPEGCELALLKFEVKCDATLKGFKLPVKFEWDEAIWNENTFSDPTGYIWYVSADPEQFPHDPTGPNYEIRKLLYFYDGGIRVDDTGVKWRGDVNLNEYAYEIADVVCFAQYFITGYLCTFGQEGITDFWYEISLNATDVNFDGITLSIADLVYMIRIILELEMPIMDPKVALVTEVASMTANVQDADVVVSSDCDANIGASAFVFKHSGAVNEVENLSNMKLEWNDQDGKLRVLVWSPKADFLPKGAHDLFSFEAEGVELVGVDAADDMGKTLNTPISLKPRVSHPKEFALAQNYPNPFNPITKIEFTLPEPSEVELKIYNISGQLVRSYKGWFKSGQHTIKWDSKNKDGDDVASGIYFYQIVAGNYTCTKQMVLMR